MYVGYFVGGKDVVCVVLKKMFLAFNGTGINCDVKTNKFNAEIKPFTY